MKDLKCENKMTDTKWIIPFIQRQRPSFTFALASYVVTINFIFEPNISDTKKGDIATLRQQTRNIIGKLSRLIKLDFKGGFPSSDKSFRSLMVTTRRTTLMTKLSKRMTTVGSAQQFKMNYGSSFIGSRTKIIIGVY